MCNSDDFEDLDDSDLYEEGHVSEFSDMDEQGFRGHPVEMAEDEDYDEGYDGDLDEPEIRFASSHSALRAASPTNLRNLPCHTCGEENRLTPEDVAQGYQCDDCAEQEERGY